MWPFSGNFNSFPNRRPRAAGSSINQTGEFEPSWFRKHKGRVLAGFILLALGILSLFAWLLVYTIVDSIHTNENKHDISHLEKNISGASGGSSSSSNHENQETICSQLENASLGCIGDVMLHGGGGPFDENTTLFLQYNQTLQLFQLKELPNGGGSSNSENLTNSSNNNNNNNFSCDFEEPCDCGSENCPPGTRWFNPQQLVEYVCDCQSTTDASKKRTTSSNNRWLHLGPDLVFEGENSHQCHPGKHLLNDNDCVAEFGGSVGGDDGNIPRLGYYIPYDITITAYGISIDDETECNVGTFDSYVCWTSGNHTDDDYDFNKRCAQITCDNGDDEVNALNLRIDVPGNRYILWGLRNHCGKTISDWNMVVYYKQRYNNNNIN